jgi:hypothetical protein
LDGLVIPDLQQVIVDFFELPLKRIEELDKLIRGSPDDVHDHLHGHKQNQHEMKCYLTEWIKQYSSEEYEADDSMDAVVLSSILSVFGGLFNRGAKQTAIRGNSLWLVRHLGTQDILLPTALFYLLSPDTSTEFSPDFILVCNKHSHPTKTRCSKCVAPLFWYLCSLYQVTNGTDWHRVFSDLVFYGFVDLAIEWINRNLDTARIELPHCFRSISLEVAKHPRINELVNLWSSLIE